MSNVAITASFIVFVILITVAFDVWIKLRQPDGNATISWVIKAASFKYPIIACCFGALMGHFFWPNDPTCPKCPGVAVHAVDPPKEASGAELQGQAPSLAR